jgi:hypothetical protein
MTAISKEGASARPPLAALKGLTVNGWLAASWRPRLDAD